MNELTDTAINLSADSIVFIDATDNATRKESAADFATALAGAGVTATNGQLTAARLSSGDQFEAASATSSDGDSSGSAIAATPEGMVQVFVNGLMVELKGDKTGECYLVLMVVLLLVLFPTLHKMIFSTGMVQLLVINSKLLTKLL